MNILPNYINSKWQKSTAPEHLDAINPTTGELLGKVPLSPKLEVNEAVESATKAFMSWWCKKSNYYFTRCRYG
ncbi:MAG: aldehyde dehydrogenase family protein [Cyanobacteriota bacterium]|nr:aldehyde dehydrogenase family protein [Cyanobacteriota bacterium]